MGARVGGELDLAALRAVLSARPAPPPDIEAVVARARLYSEGRHAEALEGLEGWEGRVIEGLGAAR